MKKVMILLAIVLALPLAVNAEIFPKVGTAGAQFLKIGVDARAVGMGQAYVPVADDISSVYWNPGGLALKDNDQIFFDHTVWVADVNREFVAYSMVTDYGVFAFSVNYLYSDWMEKTTEEVFGPNGEEFMWSDLAAGITYSQAFTDKFSFGVTAKYIREEVEDNNVNGMSVDLGSVYNTQWRNTIVAMSLRNFGANLKFDIDNDGDGLTDEDPFDLLDNDGDGIIDEDTEELSYKLPMQFSFGISSDIMGNRFEDDTYLLGSFQINNSVDREETFDLGFEYKYGNFFLRAGQQMNYDAHGFNAGFGVMVPTSIALFRFDYSWSDLGYLSEDFLNTPHRLTLKMELN
ncbi:MAG: hypothetical protein CSB55_02840 [Candidatus Cloacimonadota bacterium]|nr:MAG: hypothetical protein CSB55_02840 [Candidatus Cloacimonadota bacterium]